ncbi:MAG: chromate efflux transporter [Proteobacteria bacterium]|nr:chromate efflux transporter [Pseudomonadota bacterium]
MTPNLVPPREALRLWLKVGVLSFGGPAGQIAMMHRFIVEERRWISETRYLHALNFCMLLPGPEAQQLATYVGWLMGGVRGGLLAGGLFVLPGALFMLFLSVLYASFAQVPLVQGIFYGVKAAVVAIVLEALLRISRRALKNAVSRLIAFAAFLSLFLFAMPFPIVVIGAGVIGALVTQYWPAALASESHGSAAGETSREMPLIDRALDSGALTHVKPSVMRSAATFAVGLLVWFAPIAVIAAIAGPHSIFVALGLFFSKMAVVTFGGAYAVLAYVADQAVSTYHWLTPPEMLHGLGLAETTPGPLILVLQFVGFLAAARAATGLDPLLAGFLGTLVTLWVTFVPSFLWIFTGAPYAEAIRKVKALNGALASITAAVVGVILNLSVWFAFHALFANVRSGQWGLLHLTFPDISTVDPVAAALAAFAAFALLRLKWGMLPVLGLSAALGLARLFV